MAKTFRSAFLTALEETGIPVAEIARRSGVSKDQLNKLKQRPDARTNVDDARKVALSFGLTLDEMYGDRLVEDRDRIVRLYSELSERERSLLLAAADALPETDHGAS